MAAPDTFDLSTEFGRTRSVDPFAALDQTFWNRPFCHVPVAIAASGCLWRSAMLGRE
jgi:hypothetical protein